MAVKCVFGVCFAVLCATPVFGDGGTASGTINVAKFVEQSTPVLRRPEATPRAKVTEKFNLYEIDGSTPDELRAQMKRNGTTWNDGKVYAALTTWDIRYHYEIKSLNGRYYLDSITTDVDIVFHLPRLVPQKASEQLAASWNDYLTHLKTHEYGHRDIAVGIGEEIYQVLSSLGSAPSRKELDETATKLVRAKFQQLKQAQVDYDQETHHGKLQGAILRDPQYAGVPVSDLPTQKAGPAVAARQVLDASIPVAARQVQDASIPVAARQMQNTGVPLAARQAQNASAPIAQNASAPVAQNAGSPAI
jgi:predicted secreted Zn-dependent protease